MVAMGVDEGRNMGAEFAQKSLVLELAQWKEKAANPKLSDRAKYQKMIAIAEPLVTSAPGEPFLRGYAVLRSIERGGPDTEAAVFAIYQRVKDENEQIAYDTHNLKGQLKQQLSTFVTIASKVNFDAPTTEEKRPTIFVPRRRSRSRSEIGFRSGEARLRRP